MGIYVFKKNTLIKLLQEVRHNITPSSVGGVPRVATGWSAAVDGAAESGA